MRNYLWLVLGLMTMLMLACDEGSVQSPVDNDLGGDGFAVTDNAVDNEAIKCGNGFMDAGEVCEVGDEIKCSDIPGKSYPEGGASATCKDDCSGWRDTFCGTCGNNIVDDGEECEIGSTMDCSKISNKYKPEINATCNNSCSGWDDEDACALLTCGNEALDDGEECEIGTTIDCSKIPGRKYVAGMTATCNDRCTGYNESVCSLCGNKITDEVVGEECDDGNSSNNDDCKNNCTFNVCTDGFVRTGVENCDDGNKTNTDSCKNDCTFNFCGDEVVWSGKEQCDGGSVSCVDVLDSHYTGNATCKYDCSGYDISSCVAETRTFTCAAKPTGTVWNTVSSYTQTWSGTAWLPADSTTEYNTTASTTECRYKCAADDYHWDGSGCISNTRIYNCSAKPANTVWNTVSSYTQNWNGSAWEPIDTTPEYNTTPSTTSCRYMCGANYTWNVFQCEANTRTYNCAAKPTTGTVWNTVSSYTQTWSGSAWLPADDSTTEYNTTVSTTSCQYICATNYKWNGSQCVPYSCSGNFPYSHDGLCWSNQSASFEPWADAKTHCSGLGGRLPNITELRTLIQNCPGTVTGGACAVNDPFHLASTDYTSATCGDCEFAPDGRYSVFGDTEPFWSSSELSDNTEYAWGVGFGGGYVFSNSHGGGVGFYWRCVK